MAKLEGSDLGRILKTSSKVGINLLKNSPLLFYGIGGNILHAISPRKVNNQWPANTIVYSAGYDVYTKEEADWEALKKYFTDFLAGRENKSLLLTRSRYYKDGKSMDDSKFLYHLEVNGLNVPISAFLAMSGMQPGLNPYLLGSRKNGYQHSIEEIVEMCNKTKDKEQPELGFIPEGDDIGENFDRIFDKVEIPDNTPILWNAADTVFAINPYKALMDRDIRKFSVIMDFNAMENIPLLWKRNYYSMIKSKGKILHLKEPNRILITREGHLEARSNGIYGLFYKNRKGGKQEDAIFDRAIKQIYMHPFAIKEFAKFVLYFLNKKDSFVLDEDEATYLGTSLLNGPYPKAHVRLKARHNDPFIVRDIDSLQDLIYYYAVLERINLKIFPHYNHLMKYSEEENKFYFKEFLNEKVEGLNKKLSRFSEIYHKKLWDLYNESYREKYSYDEFMHKAKSFQNIRIPTPFEKDKVNLTILGDNLDQVEKSLKLTIGYMVKKSVLVNGKRYKGFFRKYWSDRKKYYNAN